MGTMVHGCPPRLVPTCPRGECNNNNNSGPSNAVRCGVALLPLCSRSVHRRRGRRRGRAQSRESAVAVGHCPGARRTPRQAAGRQTGHRHRARAARTRWPAPLMPCHCMQPCQESVVEVAVDVGRAMSHRGTLHLCLHLLGRETSPLGRILQIKGIRYRPAWGRGPRNLEEGREARLVARQFGIVWCPGPCRRDLVHVHGYLMLGSERKGAVAPRVSTILSVLERRSRESRREQTQILDHGPSSQQVQQQEQSKLLSSIPRYLNTYGPRKRRCHVLLLDLGNRLGSNRGLKLQRKKDLARQRQRRGCSVPIFPAANCHPSFWTGNTCEHGQDHVSSNVIPGHMAVTKARRVKEKHQIRNFEHTCNLSKVHTALQAHHSSENRRLVLSLYIYARYCTYFL